MEANRELTAVRYRGSKLKTSRKNRIRGICTALDVNIDRLHGFFWMFFFDKSDKSVVCLCFFLVHKAQIFDTNYMSSFWKIHKNHPAEKKKWLNFKVINFRALMNVLPFFFWLWQPATKSSGPCVVHFFLDITLFGKHQWEHWCL